MAGLALQNGWMTGLSTSSRLFTPFQHNDGGPVLCLKDPRSGKYLRWYDLTDGLSRGTQPSKAVEMSATEQMEIPESPTTSPATSVKSQTDENQQHSERQDEKEQDNDNEEEEEKDDDDDDDDEKEKEEQQQDDDDDDDDDDDEGRDAEEEEEDSGDSDDLPPSRQADELPPPSPTETLDSDLISPGQSAVQVSDPRSPTISPDLSPAKDGIDVDTNVEGRLSVNVNDVTFLCVHGQRDTDRGPEYECSVRIWLPANVGVPPDLFRAYEKALRLETLRKRKRTSTSQDDGMEEGADIAAQKRVKRARLESAS